MIRKRYCDHIHRMLFVQRTQTGLFRMIIERTEIMVSYGTPIL